MPEMADNSAETLFSVLIPVGKVFVPLLVPKPFSPSYVLQNLSADPRDVFHRILSNSDDNNIVLATSHVITSLLNAVTNEDFKYWCLHIPAYEVE
ncbi:hypothetical protein PENANT_c232G05542, partial [Penicillium antarcticum]